MKAFLKTACGCSQLIDYPSKVDVISMNLFDEEMPRAIDGTLGEVYPPIAGVAGCRVFIYRYSEKVCGEEIHVYYERVAK